MASFSFIITTDNHLGYKQDDHIRRKDSFMAFTEALQIARERDVDFILLGGDLFHMNKPSSSIEHKCIKIIRQHMNAETDRGTSFRRVTGNFSHFERLSHANFEDPFLKVPYPIMTIHGNHDDPTGPHAKSVCEKLATCGLLNYFGVVNRQKKDDDDDDNNNGITIEPIVLEKFGIKIALYGLGFIPDQRLRSMFEKGQVKFAKPSQDNGCFNILVVHQNRVPHVKDRYIPDDFFPKFFHLIIRGHEHDLQPPERIPDSEVNGMVYQPGSTVATSISPQEAGSKKIGLISVSSDLKMTHELITLRCQRRVLFRDISQREIFNYIKSVSSSRKMTPVEYKRMFKEYVTSCIDKMLYDHEAESPFSQSTVTGSESNVSNVYDKLHRFHLPLLRVRLEYVQKAERFDDLELVSSYYPSRVANRDMILFKKQKLIQTEGGTMENVTFESGANDDDDDETDEFDVINLGEEKRDTIDLMIFDYFTDKPESERLKALSLEEYTNAVRGAKEDGNVISKVLSKKKSDVLRRYKMAIKGEEMAELEFHDPDRVEKWLLEAFKGEVKPVIDLGGGGGDEMDFDDDDDDGLEDEEEVVICL